MIHAAPSVTEEVMPPMNILCLFALLQLRRLSGSLSVCLSGAGLLLNSLFHRSQVLED